MCLGIMPDHDGDPRDFLTKLLHICPTLVEEVNFIEKGKGIENISQFQSKPCIGLALISKQDEFTLCCHSAMQ